MEVDASLFLFVTATGLLAAGFGGAFYIVRTYRGARGIVAFLVWLVLPFPILAVALLWGDAPLSYFVMLVYMSGGAALFWWPASLLGGLIGRLARAERA